MPNPFVTTSLLTGILPGSGYYGQPVPFPSGAAEGPGEFFGEGTVVQMPRDLSGAIDDNWGDHELGLTVEGTITVLWEIVLPESNEGFEDYGPQEFSFLPTVPSAQAGPMGWVRTQRPSWSASASGSVLVALAHCQMIAAPGTTDLQPIHANWLVTFSADPYYYQHAGQIWPASVRGTATMTIDPPAGWQIQGVAQPFQADVWDSLFSPRSGVIEREVELDCGERGGLTLRTNVPAGAETTSLMEFGVLQLGPLQRYQPRTLS